MKKSIKIVVLGGNHETIPLVEEIRKEGLYSIVVDPIPESPAKNMQMKAGM
jgi:hypothetical protein